MAHNSVLMFSVFVVVMFLTTVQTNRYRQQLRPENEFQEHIVHNFPPYRLIDRSKRQDDEILDILTARGFGKRTGNINMNTIKFLHDWNELKPELERLQMSQDSSDPSLINDYFLGQYM